MYLDWAFAAAGCSILLIKWPVLLLWFHTVCFSKDRKQWCIDRTILTGLYSQSCLHFWPLSSCTKELSAEIKFYSFSFTNSKKKWDGAIIQIINTSSGLLTHVVHTLWSWLKAFLTNPDIFLFSDLFYIIHFLSCLNPYSPVSPQSNVFKTAETTIWAERKKIKKKQIYRDRPEDYVLLKCFLIAYDFPAVSLQNEGNRA